MGIVCQGCEFRRKEIEIENEEKNKQKSNVEELKLPRHFVHTIDFTQRSEAEEEILKQNKKNLKKVSSNNNDDSIDYDSNNIHKEIFSNNSSDIDSEDNDKNINKDNLNINDTPNNDINANNNGNNNNININISINNIQQNIIRKSTEDEIENIINKGEEKSTDINSKNQDNNSERLSIIHKKTKSVFNNLNLGKDSNEIKPNYQRKRRKSTTLMENSNFLKQLFLEEMKIPINQELLVQEQKGNPNEKYLLGNKIGKGTFGTVYEAKNLIFGSKVAMKIIPKNERMNNELIRNEINILKKLMHPNINRIYEFYESNQSFYLINEFCSCGELFNYINRSTLNEQQLAIIFYQVFSGLNYLHENNILHRDLKPENILISKIEKDLNDNEEYFWIQIIDFGTAKIFENDKNENSIVGSPYYIAPEVLNKDYNEKCDTWSVGVMLYMFLVGRPPFNGSNTSEIINSIKTKNYDENNPKLLERSPEVRDLIKNLLERDINKRFSAKEALNHIWFNKFNGRKLFENFEEKDIQTYIDNLLNYSFNSKIQQLVIAFLVHNLPSKGIFYTILKLYRYFNESGDCKLTKNELIKGLSKYRKKEEIEDVINNLFILLDGNNNGYIEYEEFLRACLNKKEILNDEYLKYAFKFLDKKKKGQLSTKQISYAFLVGNKNKLFEAAIENAINDVDKEGNGNINFNEFKQLMSNLKE